MSMELEEPTFGAIYTLQFINLTSFIHVRYSCIEGNEGLNPSLVMILPFGNELTYDMNSNNCAANGFGDFGTTCHL